MSHEWVPCHNFHIPPKAVKCGKDLDGSEIYVGLAHYEDDVLPAKIVPRRREAYVSYSGREFKVDEFKVLVERTLHWKSARDGHVPHGGLPAGRTQAGETLYVGRTHQEGVTLMGKVQPSERCLYAPYDGKELSFDSYQVLVLK